MRCFIRLRSICKIRARSHVPAMSSPACSALFATQRQVRDPDQCVRDQGGVPRLRRGLECRDAVLAGLVEAVGQVTEQVVAPPP